MKLSILILLPAFLLVSLSLNANERNVSKTVYDEIKVITGEEGEASSNPKYEVSIKYPRISGLDNESVQESINSGIHTFASKKKNEFVEEVHGWDYTGPVDASSSLECTYKVYNTSDGIYSVCLDIFTYYQGAAHPTTYTYSFNFSLADGKLLGLQDLFARGSDYLKIISDYCIEDLKKQWKEAGMGDYYDEEWLKEGAGPKEDNFKAFNLTPEGMLITFNSYQVGPYAIGPQEVTVPYSRLSAAADPEGALKPYVK